MTEFNELDFTPVLFRYHTHVELLAHKPDEIVYLERDVVQIIKDCIAFCVGFHYGKLADDLPEGPLRNDAFANCASGFIQFYGKDYLELIDKTAKELRAEIARLEAIDRTGHLSGALKQRLEIYKRVEKYYPT